MNANKVHEACRTAADLNAVDHGNESAALMASEILDPKQAALTLNHKLCEGRGKSTARGGYYTSCEGNDLFGLHSGEDSCLCNSYAALWEKIGVGDNHVTAFADIVDARPTGDSRAALEQGFCGDKIRERVGQQHCNRSCTNEYSRKNVRKGAKRPAHGSGNYAENK